LFMVIGGINNFKLSEKNESGYKTIKTKYE